MPPSTSPKMRALVAVLAAVTLLACLLAGYLAWLQWRASSGAGVNLAGLPSLPVQEKEPEVTLTPQEADALEAQLRNVMIQIMAGGCKIDKITKDDKGALLYLQTKDTLLRVHLEQKTESVLKSTQNQAQ